MMGADDQQLPKPPDPGIGQARRDPPPVPARAAYPWGAMLLLAVAYAAAAKIALLLAVPPANAAAIWPPSGIALAGVLLGGRRLWPGILLGYVLVNSTTWLDAGTASSLARALAVSLAIGLGATVQALGGAFLIQRLVGYRNILAQEVDALRMLVLGGPVACLVNATLGPTVLWLAGIIPADNLAFSGWTWWVGDSIGVLIFMPLICAWALPSVAWRRKQFALSVPLVLMCSLVVALFFHVSNDEERRIRADFEGAASAVTQALQDTVDAELEILQSVRGFFAAAREVSPAQFQVFAASLPTARARHDIISWIPHVGAGQRAAFEQSLRARGLSAALTERAGAGHLVPAAERADYYPIAASEPPQPGAIGVDLGADPARRRALEQALASDTATATDPVQLVERADESVVVIYMPIGERSGTPDRAPGLASAVLRVRALLSDVTGRLLPSGLGIEVADSGRGAALYSVGPVELGGEQVAKRAESTVRVADRAWQLRFTLPAQYVVARRSWQAWALLAAGLFVCALLGMLLLVLIGRGTRVEELVARGTAESRAAEQSFRSLLEASPDAMLAVDGDGVIQVSTPQAERLFGYPRVELRGAPFALLLPPNLDAAAVLGSVQGAAATAPHTGIEQRMRDKSGREFPAELSLSRVEIAGRRIVMAAVRDASERKAVEQKLAQYAGNLERSNQELEQFAYVASHDLQAPVRGVRSFAQLLQNRFKGKVLEGDGLEYLAFIDSSAAHMQALIADLLALSRVGRDDAAHEAVDAEEVLRQAEAQLAGIVRERGARITHDPLPYVRGAPRQLVQLLQNLIGNGLKFQPGPAPRVHVSAVPDGAMWRFSVRDHGIGIPPHQHERIFRIFQRLHTQESYEGTGIGLAICKKIVTRHSGTIWVESDAGQGATFHFTLPAAAA